MPDPILVVAHEATRTGAPRVLLDLLRVAVGEWSQPVSLRLLAGGPLADELLALASAPDGGTPTAVVVNSALAAAELDRVPLGVPTLVYVHEVGDALAALPVAARSALVARADRVLCVSERSRQDLLAMGVPGERVEVLPPAVRPSVPRTPGALAEARVSLGGSTSDRIVIGCGVAEWRKGPDLFVEVASKLSAHPATVFAWLGRRSRGAARLLDHDVARLGLTGRFRWIDEVDDPGPFLAAADLLLVCSREDPQPLVPIEAAFAGTATAGFATGGVASFGAEGLAAVVPFPDVAALAACAAGLLEDDAARGALADGARSWALEHRAPERLGRRFAAEVAALIVGRAS